MRMIQKPRRVDPKNMKAWAVQAIQLSWRTLHIWIFLIATLISISWVVQFGYFSYSIITVIAIPFICICLSIPVYADQRIDFVKLVVSGVPFAIMCNLKLMAGSLAPALFINLFFDSIAIVTLLTTSIGPETTEFMDTLFIATLYCGFFLIVSTVSIRAYCNMLSGTDEDVSEVLYLNAMIKNRFLYTLAFIPIPLLVSSIILYLIDQAVIVAAFWSIVIMLGSNFWYVGYRDIFEHLDGNAKVTAKEKIPSAIPSPVA